MRKLLKTLFIFASLLLVLLPAHVYAQNRKTKLDSLVKQMDTAKDINAVPLKPRYKLAQYYAKTGIDSLLMLLKNAKDGINKVLLLRRIGIYYNIKRDVPDAKIALEYFTQQLQLSRKVGFNDGVFQACNSLGAVYYRFCNYPEAEKYYLESLSAATKMKDEHQMGLALLDIGSIYQIQNNYPEALKYDDSCLRKLKGDRENISYTYLSMGQIYEAEKNYPEALKYSFLGLNLSKQLPRMKKKTGDIGILTTIGDIYQAEGNYKESQKYYSIILNSPFGYSQGRNNEEEVADVYLKFGTLKILMKEYSIAKQYLNKGLAIAQDCGARDIISECYKAFAQLYTATGDYRNALSNNNLYMAIKDSIMNTETSMKIVQMQMENDFNKKEAAQAVEQGKKDVMQKEELDKKNAIMALTIGRQHLLYFVFSIILILLFLLGLLLYNRFTLRKKLEKQLAIADERKRISAEMHDDLGSGLSKISLLSEVVKANAAAKDAMHNVSDQANLENISKSSKELVDKMGEIVWSLNSKYDKIENLIIYIRKYAMEYFNSTNIECKVDMPENIPDIDIDGETRRNIFLTVKESLHNILKHSKCSLVTITISIEANLFHVFVHDNGVGISFTNVSGLGNGLNNMKKRIEDMNGRFEIKNHDGTTVEFKLPLKTSP